MTRRQCGFDDRSDAREFIDEVKALLRDKCPASADEAKSLIIEAGELIRRHEHDEAVRKLKTARACIEHAILDLE